LTGLEVITKISEHMVDCWGLTEF